MEEAARARGQHQSVHVERSGRLAGDRHVGRIPSELLDVRGDPLERADLVEETEVAGRLDRVVRFGPQRRMREEAERTESIGDADDDDPLASREQRAVEHARRRVAPRVAPAVDPDEDGPALRPGRDGLGVDAGRPDVEVEAVFVAGEAGVRLGRHAPDPRADLRTGPTRGQRIEGLGPGLGSPRCTPAERADGRLREGQAQPGVAVGVGGEAHDRPERQQSLRGDVRHRRDRVALGPEPGHQPDARAHAPRDDRQPEGERQPAPDTAGPHARRAAHGMGRRGVRGVGGVWGVGHGVGRPPGATTARDYHGHRPDSTRGTSRSTRGGVRKRWSRSHQWCDSHHSSRRVP